MPSTPITPGGDGGPPLLSMRGIDKHFPGVHALRDVDLTLHAGEVLALLGENGAGKSTLMKVLGGAHSPDAGTIEIDGEETGIASPVDSQRAGIGVIYQEFNLVPGLTAAENIFLGQEPSRVGFVPLRRERRRARELFTRLGVEIDPSTPCSRLTVAQQQIVEIAKALALDVRILVMDEPSATLTIQEVERLFAMVRELRAQGIGVIYISHRLEEVFEVADSVMIMRDGALVERSPIAGLTRERIIESMVGRKLESEFPARQVEIGEPLLEVEGLARGDAVRDVSFTVRRGEILGLTGLVGAGRTETARLVFGADSRERGEIRLRGERVDVRDPRQAIRCGIGLLTEDRKRQGLVLGHSVVENFGLPNLSRFSRRGFVDTRREARDFDRYVETMRIKTPGRRALARNLSGGNQQKIVMAKWLARDCDVLIFDEPTRGVDVGAKYEIYQLMNELAGQGKSIVMISSELPEVLGMSDRILVMHEGRITGEIRDVASATQEIIMHLAVGGDGAGDGEAEASWS